MIRSIILRNFQTHEFRTLELKPGLNVITGPTDTGKSAIIRALAWLSRHRNQNFTKHGTADMSVAVGTDLGTVQRFRNKQKGYTVNGVTYVAVGSEQPVSVYQVLPLDDVNFQFQHDAPFLLSLSPGQSAKEINRIVDLGQIDACIAWCKKELSAAQAVRKSVEAEVSGLSEEAEKLSWATEAEVAWTGIRELMSVLDGIEITISTMDSAVSGISDAYSRVSGISGLLEALGTFLAEIPDTPDVRELETVIRQHDESSAKLSTLDRLIQEFAGFEKLLTEKRNAETEYVDLYSVVSDVLESENEVTRMSGEIVSLEKELGVCPTCGKPFNSREKHGGHSTDCG